MIEPGFTRMSSPETVLYLLQPEAGRTALSAERLNVLADEVARITASPQFRTSKRCCRFLAFVVEKAAAGQAELLKERTLGVEILQRDPMFDTGEDASVRVAAGEVRKRLAQYYQSASEGPVRISLPVGSYAPEFHWRTVPAATVIPAPPEAVVVAPATARKLPALHLAGLLAALLVFCGAAVWMLWSTVNRTASGTADMEAFWAPMLVGKKPTLISIGLVGAHQIVSGASEQTRARPIGYGLVPLGDSISLSRVSAVLTARGREFRVQGDKDTTFSDLRDTPAILIGANSNQWTVLAHSDLRYTFASTAKFSYVRDRESPLDMKWATTNHWPDTIKNADFAIVSRCREPNTKSWVVTLAGVAPFGTQAAGELVTDPVRLTETLRKLPRGWESKNLQIVLMTRIVGNSGGPPVVLTTHVW
ncbi:MAG: hypothetical protein H7Y20_07275 [Bryobacteraceae bacterium]|nr:hypothetical protein [Bryobacteraceae bacterium]